MVGFFTLNPDEELAIDDIAAKFVEPGDSRNIHAQLAASLDHDLLRYESSTAVYRKGAFFEALPGREDER